MASLIWTSVYLFLLMELAITSVLVVPVPRRIRNIIARKIFTLNLGKRLGRPIMFIACALGLALLESYFTSRRIIHRMQEEHDAGMSHAHDRIYHGHDKERKFRAERNMYLAGFALTLLFVIGRITQLMQESVELEEETDRVKKFVKEAAEHEEKQKAQDGQDDSKPKQPADKKKD